MSNNYHIVALTQEGDVSVIPVEGDNIEDTLARIVKQLGSDPTFWILGIHDFEERAKTHAYDVMSAFIAYRHIERQEKTEDTSDIGYSLNKSIKKHLDLVE